MANYLIVVPEEERRAAKKWILRGFLIGMIILIILLKIGFPNNLWTPIGSRELLRCFLTVVLIICGSIILSKLAWFEKEKDLRLHQQYLIIVQEILSFSGQLSTMTRSGFITSVVLFIRYLYLIIH